MARTKKRVSVAVALGVAVAVAVAGECVARAGLGLGTPPLYLTDPDIEYVLKPGQALQRFGKRYEVNRFSMRSAAMDPYPASGERRVLLFGDSVLNGGAQVDQPELASEILRQTLVAASSDPVTVGNVSAFSWGPGNWLAYAKRYGFFGADTIVVVVNSGDWGDAPTFAPLDPLTHPSRTPVSALWEGAVRYLPRYLPGPVRDLVGGPRLASANPALIAASAPAARTASTASTASGAGPGDFQSTYLAAQRAASLADFRMLLSMALATGARVSVVMHFRDAELDEPGLPEGLRVLSDAAAALGVPSVSARDGLLRDRAQAYQDDIHLTTHGQQVLAEALLASVAAAGSRGWATAKTGR